MRKKKLIIIGLDGATFTLLKPWAEDGTLPNIKKLLEKGSHGTLESTIPPATCPAWPTMATGKNQGKLGLYFFFNRTGSSYETAFMHSSRIKGQCFWDYLSKEGRKVGLVAYPLLYPTYAINGFMISGLGAEKSKGWVFPSSLEEKINKISPDYAIQCTLNNIDEGKLLEDISHAFDQQRKLVEHLIEDDLDCLVYVLSMTDWMQHAFWRHMDPEYPGYDAEGSCSLLKNIKELYSEFDALVGTIIERYKNANILIISDHGFGPRLSTFNLKAWLSHKGYLKLKRNSPLIKVKVYAYENLRKLSHFLNLKEHFPSFMNKAVSITRLNLAPRNVDVDFEKSTAFVLEGGIFINLKGRDQKGRVELENYERLKRKIKNDLLNLKNEFGGINDVVVYDSSDIYQGEKTRFAPDLIPVINDWSCTYTKRPHDGQYSSLFKPLEKSDLEISGSHRMEGVLIAYGPDIKKGFEIKGSNIIDIMPTTMFLFGLDIPPDVDGKVLAELLSPESELYTPLLQHKLKKSPPQKHRLKELKEKLAKLGNNAGR